MRANRLRITRFRALEDLDLELAPTTVIIGENNAGKTTVLDAIRLTLSHRWGLRGTGFDEYDFFLSKEEDDPKKSAGITIEIDFVESEDDEWSADLITDAQALGILQTKPDGTNIITIRATYSYDVSSSSFEATWCFLNLDGAPLKKPTSRASNLYGSFFNYIPVFSLSAIRDANLEFSDRSQFWGKLIKSIHVPEEEWADVYNELMSLNDRLIGTDEKFAAIKQQLENVKSVIPPGSVDSIDLRALPLREWDLISKTELLVRAAEDDPPLPLECFGQGVQSLAVVNVFRAFVDNLLQDEYESDSEPVLLLEEPESHLHPQAARAFYHELSNIRGQKVITTHSPYFLQSVPFEEIRLLRKTASGIRAFFISNDYREKLDRNDALDELLAKYQQHWYYDPHLAELVISEPLDDKPYRELLQCYKTKDEKAANHPRVKQLRIKADAHIPAEDLLYLQESAKRIRGEIFFARKWLIVEGPTDYVFMHAAAEVLDFPLDVNGVALIDCQVHGKAPLFAALARVFGFPWAALLDGDSGGDNIVATVKKQRFADDFLDEAVCQFDKKMELEDAVVASVPTEIVNDILLELGKYDGSSQLSNKARAKRLKNARPLWALIFRTNVQAGVIEDEHLPAPVKDVIAYIASSESYQ